MTPEQTAQYFSDDNGTFRFARWQRPLAPVVFGTDDATLDQIKAAIQEVAGLCDLSLSDVDPEFGANFLVFFCSDWSELDDVPDLDAVIPDLRALIQRLSDAGANQYRLMRHDEAGAICLSVNLIRMNNALAGTSARDLALSFTAKSLLLWGTQAFAATDPVAKVSQSGVTIVTPEIAALLRSAYDPRIPVASDDPSLALRLAARATLLLGDLTDDPRS